MIVILHPKKVIFLSHEIKSSQGEILSLMNPLQEIFQSLFQLFYLIEKFYMVE